MLIHREQVGIYEIRNMKIDKDEITKELRNKVRNKECEFYRGSQILQVENASIKTTNYVECEYCSSKKLYNYKVSGSGEFTIVNTQTKDLTSNGLEYYEVLIQIVDDKISSIGRVNIYSTPR